jgi:phosphosulfolactate synthase (CoM biosynthesis protein A)
LGYQAPFEGLLEICAARDKEDFALKSLAGAGFDTIELSEGVTDVPRQKKKRVAEFAYANLQCADLPKLGIKDWVNPKVVPSRDAADIAICRKRFS